MDPTNKLGPRPTQLPPAGGPSAPAPAPKNELETPAPARADRFEEKDGGDEGESEVDDPVARVNSMNFTGRDPAELTRLLGIAEVESKRDAVGGSWKTLGPPSLTSDDGGPRLNSGRPTAVVVDPKNTNTIYLASADGGVWKTTDAGKSWAPITENAPSQTIGALAMDPSDSNTLFAGFGEDFSNQMPGLIKSTDGGKTWSAPVVLSGTYPGESKPVTAVQTRDLKVSPDDPKIVLAATDAGLFRSTDGGQSFQLSGLPKEPGAQADPHAWSLGRTGPHTWLATVQDEVNEAGQGFVYRSTDDGATWQKVSLGANDGKVGRMTIAVADGTAGTDHPRVYVLAAAPDGKSQADVLRSDDGGQTFQGLGVNASGRPANPNGSSGDLNLMHDQAWYNQMIAVDPKNPDNLLIGGNLSTARSTDGGKTWALESDWAPFDPNTYVHADLHAGAIYYDEQGQQHTLVGSDGGLFRTDGSLFTGKPMGAKWDDSMNAGLSDLLARSIATDFKGQLVSGLQDNGTVTLQNGKFQETSGGDGWGTITGADPKIVLGSVNGRHLRSTDGGKTWRSAESGLPGGTAPFDVRYANVAGDTTGKQFLTISQEGAGKAGVFKTTDGGASWKRAVGTVHGADGTTSTAIPGTIRAISSNPKDPNQWLASTGEGRVYLTTDGGKNWTESAQLGKPDPIFDQPDNIKLYGMSFDAADPGGQSFWVSQGGRGEPGHEPAYVFKTTDGGKTFAPISQGSAPGQLPDVPTNVLKQDPKDPSVVYVGNVLGVYRSKDGGATWDRFGQGLPMVSVTDLELSPDSGTLRIATYGRGFYEIPTTDPAPPPASN